MDLISEHEGMRGELQLRIRRFSGPDDEEGEVILDETDKNLILKRAKNLCARLIAGESLGIKVVQIAFGINPTLPEPDNNAITSAFIKAISSIEFPADGQVRFNFSLLRGEANGKKITEFGLRLTDGTYYARKVRGGIEKESDLAFDGSWTIIF